MKRINAKNAPAAIGPYSQAYVVNGILYTSGTLPLDPVSGNIVEGGIKEQTQQVIANIDAILKEAGCKPSDVIKTTCFLSDMANFAPFNEVYATYFTSNPARSCVAVKELPKQVLVEIELIAENAQ